MFEYTCTCIHMNREEEFASIHDPIHVKISHHCRFEKGTYFRP